MLDNFIKSNEICDDIKKEVILKSFNQAKQIISYDNNNYKNRYNKSSIDIGQQIQQKRYNHGHIN
jgi:hypothetical protein